METLRFKSVFDIIGPIMVGPSSSHTAGATRIGRIVRSIFSDQPTQVDIYLYGSFAKTYRGHGTDIAIVGGILGMEPSDERLPNALKIAYEEGIEVAFIPLKEERCEHPNTARIVLKNATHTLSVTGISIGGGNIQVTQLNGFDISLSMGTPTFIITHQDIPGMISKVTNVLNAHEVNIAQMNVTRLAKGDKAIMIIEVDDADGALLCKKISKIEHLEGVTFFD